MTITFTQVAAVGAALFTQAACSSTPRPAPPPPRDPQQAPKAPLDAATLRAQGPDGLARALVAYDAATDDDRAELAELVDRVAAQRYATTSRLFWYTDLDDAKAAAKASGKNILSLRLLGRLDEDQSCANSRFFRVALYGNAALASWLRANFVMHWSSERPVPKVTIDLGDGRTITTTVAGNSAHYVLDADGQVLDVIPGLMTPKAFQHELAATLKLDGDLVRYHEDRLAAIAALWDGLSGVTVPIARGAGTIADAEALTVTKMYVERPMVQAIELGDDPTDLAVDSEAWQSIGLQVLDKLGLERADTPRMRQAILPNVLDESSRALVASLAPVNWARPGAALDAGELEDLIRGFEATLIADSGINLTRLREQIHTELRRRAVYDDRSFESVNRWLYATVFQTPADDAWLGLSTPGTFTGLPGDGVSSARRTR